jgi:branched-chain amino acid transport system ATP-binding protein
MRKKVLSEVYALFPILSDQKNQAAGTLSGGEQQMLAIGRALMSLPSLLMLDEPSLGLAPLIVANIFQVISKVNEQGSTVLLVEQNVEHPSRSPAGGMCWRTVRLSWKARGRSS